MLSIRLLDRFLETTVYNHVFKFSPCCLKRHYWHPKTHVFERVHPLQLVGKGKYPLLKKKQYIYRKLKPDLENYSKTMICILTEEIDGVGMEGQVVEVTKSRFRNELYPSGLAVYASPENMKKYEEIRQSSRHYGIDYSLKLLMMKIGGFHVHVEMNTDTDWVLNEDHIRIMLRQQGILLDNENIKLTEDPITKPGSFKFWIQAKRALCIQMNGTVHPVGETYQLDELEVLYELSKSVYYYEDVFGDKEATSTDTLDNGNNMLDSSEDKLEKTNEPASPEYELDSAATKVEKRKKRKKQQKDVQKLSNKDKK